MNTDIITTKLDFVKILKDYEDVEKNLGQIDYVDERGLFFHKVDDTLWVWHSGAKCWFYEEGVVVKGELIPMESVELLVSLQEQCLAGCEEKL